MLAASNGIRTRTLGKGYVCLNCRLQSSTSHEPIPTSDPFPTTTTTLGAEVRSKETDNGTKSNIFGQEPGQSTTAAFKIHKSRWSLNDLLDFRAGRTSSLPDGLEAFVEFVQIETGNNFLQNPSSVTDEKLRSLRTRHGARIERDAIRQRREAERRASEIPDSSYLSSGLIRKYRADYPTCREKEVVDDNSSLNRRRKPIQIVPTRVSQWQEVLPHVQRHLQPEQERKAFRATAAGGNGDLAPALSMQEMFDQAIDSHAAHIMQHDGSHSRHSNSAKYARSAKSNTSESAAIRAANGIDVLSRGSDVPRMKQAEFLSGESLEGEVRGMDEIIEKQMLNLADSQVKGPMGTKAKLSAKDSARRESTAHKPAFAWQKPSVSSLVTRSFRKSPTSGRPYHTSTRTAQEASVAIQPSLDGSPFTNLQADGKNKPNRDGANGIRAQLRKWQELHGDEEKFLPARPQDDVVEDGCHNAMSRLSEDPSANQADQDDAEEGRTAYLAGQATSDKDSFEGPTADESRFWHVGDLAELARTDEGEGELAVFVRYVTNSRNLGQFITSRGRWKHVTTTLIPYTLRGWAEPELVEPLKRYLPDPETLEDVKALTREGVAEDLDIPREVAQPVVSRLVAFNDEVRQIYRRHSAALDNAHDYLAHETDLRYGSIASAVTALLKTPANELSTAAFLAVRRALSNGGFAFNFDRSSHRLTGYMQIRSKEQVRMVNTVRDWIRDWQDDLASMSDERSVKFRPSKGGTIITGFIEKSKEIIAKHRENRRPYADTVNISISEKRLPITENSDCIQLSDKKVVFNESEENLVKFIEAWCCSRIFQGHNRLESLPPLLLNAVDMYPGLQPGISAGFLFLQELGTITPWENLVRFDQHLLLPSSQHSKPLQKLMNSILSMQKDHDLSDSMAPYRRDWKHTPVYCIDSSSAHEIDDGISVESAEAGPNGKEQHWIHVHIANPSAFFQRDHPLAKMARHMGETVYMPERAYLMLPKWATQRFFSLAPDRPCLTFSTKVDSEGNFTEEKITPGTIRNVLRLTYDDVNGILGDERTHAQWFDLLVGADKFPAGHQQQSDVSKLSVKNKEELKVLYKLARQLQEKRRRAGGMFFEMEKPETNVWQSIKGPGLAWDHPFRKGSRTLLGDPVINVHTRSLPNWFSVERAPSNTLVSEVMLLCSSAAAKWCADRNIPIIYRGTQKHPNDQLTMSEAAQRGAELVKQGVDIPMHVGVPYLLSRGQTELRTVPMSHAHLGLDYYSKVSSPLRRYGDMMVHWQIEAAIRHEADTDKSLIVARDDYTTHDRSFLPFSRPVLESILLGLNPRERLVAFAKAKSQEHWETMMLYRKTAFPGIEGPLPFDKLHFYVSSDPAMVRTQTVPGYSVEMNLPMMMKSPKEFGFTEEPRRGDIWEVEISKVIVYRRATIVVPKRLLGREMM